MRDPPRGMDYGHCVTHLLFIYDYLQCLKEKEIPFDPEGMGQKGLQTCLGKKMNEGGGW